MIELKKHLVTVAVSGWQDRAVVARDTNEAKQLALAGECTVAKSDLTPIRVIGTEVVGLAPATCKAGAWKQDSSVQKEALDPDDAVVQQRRADHLREAFYHITDAGGMGDTIAIGPSPNDDGTVNVFLVSSLGERSPCEVTLAPDDLDNLAKAARAALALHDVEDAVERARRQLREGKIPTGPTVVP